MTRALQLVEILKAETKSRILKPGDVEIKLDAIAPALALLGADDGNGDGSGVGEAEARLGDVDQLRELLPSLPAPYKRVVLSASHVHNTKRYRAQEWTAREHLEECLRQNRAYFRRRGVATSLDMDNKVAFGDKGITGTANDRDVFIAFMKRIGLEDAISPNAVANAVVKGLRENEVTRDQPEDVYAGLFSAMAMKPGQNVEREVFDEIVTTTGLESRADEAYELLCELTKKRYASLNDAITRAHGLLQVSLTLEQEGIARFALNNPFGLAIPYEGSLFRVYELDEAMHVSRVCPTFFGITGGDEDDDPFETFAVSGGGFADLDGMEKFRIGEVYVPVTIQQLARVGQFAVEHCNFDVSILTADGELEVGAAETISSKISGLEITDESQHRSRTGKLRDWPAKQKPAGESSTPAE